MKNKVATTVKIPEPLYDDFKVLGIRHKVSLQTLVEKCIYLFVTDEKFRAVVTSYSLPGPICGTPVKSVTVLSSSCEPTQ